MSYPHTCKTFDPHCFRCELNLDELRDHLEERRQEAFERKFFVIAWVLIVITVLGWCAAVFLYLRGTFSDHGTKALQPTVFHVDQEPYLRHQVRTSRSRPIPARMVHAARPRRAVPHSPRIKAHATVTGRFAFSDTELRIRSCESGPNGYATHGHAHDFDYANENPSSTASGAWQVVDGTWAGYGGYSHAGSAPRRIQDAWARMYFDKNGYRAWTASASCWH